MSKLTSPGRSPDASNPTSPEKERSGGTDDSDDSPLISKLHDRLKVSNAPLPVDWEGTEGREEEYEGLAILNLSNNLISEIPENFPCLCPKLVRLDLSHNRIAAISLPRSFPAELKQINLSYNQLDAIDCRNAMAKPLPCTNPQTLYESGNTIYVDNVSFCVHRSHMHMVRLGVLEVTHCQLQEVNFFCPGPRNKQTDGSTKKPQFKPAVVGGTTKAVTTNTRLVCPLVTRLILSHNQLVRVPESVCEMTSLNSLDLSHNDIIDLPAEMGNLSNLWEFPLAGLKLISPPQNIIERGKTKDIIGFLWSLLQR
jgi:Leucine-rich repeat (LRR) protein